MHVTLNNIWRGCAPGFCQDISLLAVYDPLAPVGPQLTDFTDLL